jgi:hypothetical protein
MTMSQILNRTADQVFALTHDAEEAEKALKTAAAALSFTWGKDAQKLYAYMLEEFETLRTEEAV